MGLSFARRLDARAERIGSLLCVGLDPHPEDLPRQDADAARDFCLRIIEATADVALAFKPNAAFFERLGPDGGRALTDIIRAVPDEIPVILDAKRGDISSTARAYAEAVFDRLDADAVTLHGYLGHDSVAPFTDRADRGVFVLCKTSNPSSAELQDLTVVADGRARGPLYRHVASLARGWNARDNVGLVVGATAPAALAEVRSAAPELWILAPGVGAQGGDLDRTIAAGLRADGAGLLLSVSRGISRAPDPRAAAQELVARIAAARRARRPPEPAPDEPGLPEGLLDAGCVRFGTFTLKSGATSPVYIDLRRLVADPALMGAVARAYAGLLEGLTFDHLAALPYAALPIGTAVALEMGRSLVYPRREAKGYGTKAQVEGVFSAGDRAVVLDDLATTGGSKIEAIDKLSAAGLTVQDIVVLIDRESGAREMLTAAGYRFHAVFRLGELVERWRRSGRIDGTRAQAVRDFILSTGPT